MICLFGDTIIKDIDFVRYFRAEGLMETEYDVRFEEHHNLQNGGCIVKKIRKTKE